MVLNWRFCSCWRSCGDLVMHLQQADAGYSCSCVRKALTMAVTRLGVIILLLVLASRVLWHVCWLQSACSVQ